VLGGDGTILIPGNNFLHCCSFFNVAATNKVN